MPVTRHASIILPRPRRVVGPTVLSLTVMATVILSISLLNVVVLRKDFQQQQQRISVDNKNEKRLLQADVLRRELMDASLKQEIYINAEAPRTLVGIFSRDDEAGATQRGLYRRIIEEKKSRSNEIQICSLPQFWKRRKRLRNQECQLVYTFVVGAHRPDDTTIPTEIHFTEQKREILVDRIPSPFSSDVNLPDVTRLNIRYVI